MPDVLVWEAAVAVAAITSALVVVAISRDSPRWIAARAHVPPVAAVVAGALLGQLVIGLWPRWPPLQALDRFLTIGLPAAVALQLVVRWRPMADRRRYVTQSIFALVLVRLLLHRSVYVQDDALAVSALTVGSAGLLLAVQWSLARLWVRTRQPSVVGGLAATVLAAGLLVLMAGYIKGGSAAFPWGSALAGAAIGASLTGRRADLSGVTELAVIVLFGAVFIGRFFGGLTNECALLVMLTPLACWVPEMPVARTWPAWQREFLRLALVGTALVALLWSGKRTFDREMAPLVRVVETKKHAGLHLAMQPRV